MLKRLQQAHYLLLEFSATISVEMRIVSYRVATDIAHESTTCTSHFVATNLLDELLLAFPASPGIKQKKETGPQTEFDLIKQLTTECHDSVMRIPESHLGGPRLESQARDRLS
jgi:hypothetical protein